MGQSYINIHIRSLISQVFCCNQGNGSSGASELPAKSDDISFHILMDGYSTDVSSLCQGVEQLGLIIRNVTCERKTRPRRQTKVLFTCEIRKVHRRERITQMLISRYGADIL